jgi:hypothetical protein
MWIWIKKTWIRCQLLEIGLNLLAFILLCVRIYMPTRNQLLSTRNQPLVSGCTLSFDCTFKDQNDKPFCMGA